MSVDNWLGIDIHNCEFFRELREKDRFFIWGRGNTPVHVVLDSLVDYYSAPALSRGFLVVEAGV